MRSARPVLQAVAGVLERHASGACVLDDEEHAAAAAVRDSLR